MEEAVFAGRLFKNNKNSWSTILIYALFVVVFGLLATLVLVENKTIQWIAGGALLVVLIAVGLVRKLTFNEPDDKNIYISRRGIGIGMERYEWGQDRKSGYLCRCFLWLQVQDFGYAGEQS